MNYQVRPLGKTCHKTGDRLRPGTRCCSVLIWQEGQMVRRDYAADAWDGPPEGAIGYWWSEIPEKDESQSRPLQPEEMLAYFEQLTEEASPNTEKLRYVISLWLLKKRRLLIDGAREDGEVIYLRVIGSRSEGPWEVRDFQLPEEELAQMQQSLKTHFEQEWDE